jgi:hypothetical protein
VVIAGCTTAVSLGHFANIFNASSNPHVYGYLIFIYSLIGYLGSIPSFWKAGQEYEKFLKNN